MCGFVGFCNLKRKISNKLHTLEEMTKSIAKRGPDEEDFYINNNAMLRS